MLHQRFVGDNNCAFDLMAFRIARVWLHNSLYSGVSEFAYNSLRERVDRLGRVVAIYDVERRDLACTAPKGRHPQHERAILVEAEASDVGSVKVIELVDTWITSQKKPARRQAAVLR